MLCEWMDSARQFCSARPFAHRLMAYKLLTHDPDTVAFLWDELSWVSAELGEVRNAEFQSTRLTAMIEDPAAREFIAQSLDARAQAARSGALAALRSDRHGFLLEDLIIMVAEPPVTADAFAPAKKILRRCVGRSWRKLSSAVGAADARSNDAS